jgi:hypothetical protein
MDKKIIFAEAQELANRMTPDEIRSTIQDREPTEVEHLAILLSMHREIDERIAGEKAECAKQEKTEDVAYAVAETMDERARERFGEEKLRHQLAEEGFKEEKAKHKAERARHLSIEAGFAEEKAKHKAEKARHLSIEAGFAEEKAKHKAEKARYLLAEEGFAEEKANHKAERERHAQAVARFRRDIEPLREIKRAEKEAERIDNVEGCRAGSGRISELRVPPRDAQSEGHPTTPLPV